MLLPGEQIYSNAAIHWSIWLFVALFAGFIKRNARIATDLAKEKWLPTVTRNVNLSEETTQAIYQMIQNPSRTSIIAGTGVLALSAMAFMGKTFLDGYKDIWIKRKEADIQKNLQEKLIDIETQSFSGKIQITRSMLSKKAIELSRYLNYEPDKKVKTHEAFQALMFKGDGKTYQARKGNNSFNYFIAGLGTLAGIIGLGFLSLKLLTKSKGHLEKFVKDAQSEIAKVVEKSTDSTKKQDMLNLENLFKTVESSEEEIRQALKPLNWSDKEDFINRISKEIGKSTVDANMYCGGGKTPKPAFYSHVNDYRAFLYNYLLDTDNAQFKALFLGTTGLTAIGYGGKLLGDAIKEVQVKKYNAQTEAELQQRLVSTELKNFKSKKDSAIQPLMDEFYKQARLGKPKEELKVMAENILLEIKNGPPYVYS